MEKTLKANSEVIKRFAQTKKCFMCKHKFEESLLLPVEEMKLGVLQPRLNGHYVFHLQDTHGLPYEFIYSWVVNSVYGRPLNATTF